MFGDWQSLQYAAVILLWLLAVIKVAPQKSYPNARAAQLSLLQRLFPSPHHPCMAQMSLLQSHH